MRIITVGKIPPLKEKMKNCRTCGTKMAYTTDDICFDMDLDKYILCPVCKKRLYTSIFDKKVKK